MLPRLPNAPHEPLYIRLKRALREVIGTEYQPGERLPSEVELCSHYGLSRITVRAALAALANEGVLERVQGRGSFVSGPKRAEHAVHFPSITETMAAYSPEPDIRIVSFEDVAADPRVAMQLELPLPAAVHKVRRVKAPAGRPLCYQVSYLPVELWPGLEEAALTTPGMLPSISRCSLVAESVEATVADKFRADLLHVRTGVPLLVVDSVFANASGHRLEYNRTFYSARDVRLVVSARLSSDGPLEVEAIEARG